MLSWNDEVNQMLIAFDRQAKYSLANIKIALNREGKTFNTEFKQYFLHISNERIKNSYHEFEIDSIFENQINVSAYDNTSAIDTFSVMNTIYTKNDDFNDIQNQMFDPVEIIDSSDEEDQPGNRIKMKTSKRPFGIQCNGHRETFQLNDVFENDDDGSYADKLPDTNLISIDYHEEVSNEGQDSSKKKAASAITGMIVVDDLKMESKNKRTSTVTSNNGSKVIDNTTGRSTGCSKEAAELGLIPQSTRNKKSNSLNRMKNRFKCRVCEYSSNYMSYFNRHMRIHTGEKPYKCDICQKGFAQRGNMNTHKMTHTDEIPFHCRGCFTGFWQKTDQEAHENVCKSRRYECHICKKFVTVGKTLLKRHMRKHIGENMRYFSQKSNLKTHLNTIHTF